MAENTYSVSEICDRFGITRAELERAISIGELKINGDAPHLVLSGEARRWLTERELTRLEFEWLQQDRRGGLTVSGSRDD